MQSALVVAGCARRTRSCNAVQVYIIGGVVDKNRHKGLSLERATTHGIATGRLPIDEYVRMTACRVLTTVHGAWMTCDWQCVPACFGSNVPCYIVAVVEILNEYVKRKDWKEAFLAVIPMRKTRADGGSKRKRKHGSRGVRQPESAAGSATGTGTGTGTGDGSGSNRGSDSDDDGDGDGDDGDDGDDNGSRGEEEHDTDGSGSEHSVDEQRARSRVRHSEG